MHSTNSERLTALDAIRGMAMLCVCMAHIAHVYSSVLHPTSVLLQTIIALTKIASPTFVLVSGITLGYLHVRHKDFRWMRLHLADRALCTLTAGHVLLAASFAANMGWGVALSQVYITDTIGFCVLGGLFILRYVQARFFHLGLGAMLYLIGWIGWNLWHPDVAVLIFLKVIFFGPAGNGQPVFMYPLISWFGVYLIGISIGRWISTFERGDLIFAGRNLAGLSLIVLGSAVFSKALLSWFLIPDSTYLLLFSLSKYPPGPLYIIMYGSGGLLLIGGMLFYSRESQHNSWLPLAEHMGRNSLSLFISQSFLYYTLLYLLLVNYKVTLPLTIAIMIGSLCFMVWLGGLFEQCRLNRLWTLGLPVLAQRWPRLRAIAVKARVG